MRAPPSLHSTSMGSRVTPGSEYVMARLRPRSTLKSVDLPTLGLPRIATRGKCTGSRRGDLPGGEIKPILHPPPHSAVDLRARAHRHEAPYERLRLHDTHRPYDPIDQGYSDGTH